MRSRYAGAEGAFQAVVRALVRSALRIRDGRLFPAAASGRRGERGRA